MNDLTFRATSRVAPETLDLPHWLWNIGRFFKGGFPDASMGSGNDRPVRSDTERIMAEKFVPRTILFSPS